MDNVCQLTASMRPAQMVGRSASDGHSLGDATEGEETPLVAGRDESTNETSNDHDLSRGR